MKISCPTNRDCLATLSSFTLAEVMVAVLVVSIAVVSLYAGVSSYNADRTTEAARLLREMGVPALIHQPSYSMINRWIEDDLLLDTLEEEGMGCIAFAPLAQGMLTDRYLNGIPEGSRASQGKSLDPRLLTDGRIQWVKSHYSISDTISRWANRPPNREKP